MIDIRSILDPACTRVDVDANSRKRLLEYAADLLADHHDLAPRELFDELMNRERLGSTGLGEGVAIPHCRTGCDSIHAALLRLEHPVDYDAADGKPVDLLCVLVVPPDETTAHLELLAELARAFGEESNRDRLRAAANDAELYEEIVGLISSRAA